jgi:hypothetical protein
MAKRKQLFHPDDVKAKIQASQLINRLQRHALGEIEMTQTQIGKNPIGQISPEFEQLGNQIRDDCSLCGPHS